MSLVSGRIYRPDVDGLRAIAVLAVVFFHAEIPYFQGGFVGVDVFFVISGYLITRNILNDIEQGHFSLSSFYIARIKRLFPAFLFALLITFALGFLILSPIHFSELGKTTINAVLSLSNIFFWQDADYFATDSQYIPLLHTWSLSVEEQFYAIWPLFLILCMGATSRSVLFWLMVLIGCVSLYFSTWVANVDGAAGFYLMPFRMFEFCIGAACIWVENKRKTGAVERELATLAGFGMIAVSIIAYSVKTPFPSYYALLPCVGAALLILYGNSSVSGALLRNRLAVAIGLISYSLYLFHWPLLVYGRYVKFGELNALETAAVLLLSVVLAILSFRFIEKPLRQLKIASKTFSAQTMVVGSLCVALLTVFLGAHAWGGKGWKFRIDREARRIMSLASIDVYSPCGQPSVELQRNGYRCVFGANRNDEKIDAVLLGDSHAEHWIPGLDQVFKETGVRAAYAGHGGSLPFVVGESVTADGPSGFSYKKAFEYIHHLKPKLVILGGRWAAYAHASRPDGAALWYSVEELNLSGRKASRKAITIAAGKTLEHLSATPAKVLVLGQVPLVGIDLIACLSRPKIVELLRRNPDCNGLTAAQVKGRNQVISEMFSQLTDGSPQTTYVDYVEQMCGSEYCDKVTGKSVLYRDDDHLSFQGSVDLVKLGAAEKIKMLLNAN